MSLKDFWDSISSRKDDWPEPAILGGGCFIGLENRPEMPPLQDAESKRVSEEIDKQIDIAAERVLQYGMGVFKIEAVDLLCDSDEVIREVRTVNSNINTISGIPSDDKARKRLQAWTYLIEYFPDTFLSLVEVSVAGNEQHNPGQPMHWAREKSKDHFNTAFRHLFERGRGVKRDTDGQRHLAKAIWRLSAQLQLDIEQERSETIQESLRNERP